MVRVDAVVDEIREHGGFEAIELSPHMRFRAGQRRIDWEELVSSLRNGDIGGVRVNGNPNESIPYKRAYILDVNTAEGTLRVPFYILEDGRMRAVTVIR